jgi:hypothetical protein
VLYLRTDQPDLVGFKEEVLELEGGATGYIGMRFKGGGTGGGRDVLVFLNDEADGIEECLQVRVVYSG